MLLLYVASASAAWPSSEWPEVPLADRNAWMITAKWVETPFGRIHARQAIEACVSTSVRIGTIASATTYAKDVIDDDGKVRGNTVYSDITMSTERTVVGTPSATYDLRVRGGRLDGEWFSADPYLPSPEVGRRYLTATRTMAPSLMWPEGFERIVLTVHIDPGLALPTAAVVRGMMRDMCEGIERDMVRPRE